MQQGKTTFPFTLGEVQVECAHCAHQLEGSAKFGLDIVRCSNCNKFTQIVSRTETARVKTPIRSEE